MSKILAFLGGVAICATLMSGMSLAQNIPPTSSEKAKEHNLGEVSAKQVNKQEINYGALGSNLEEAGGYLRKAAKAYTLMPTRTLDLINKEENPDMLIALSFFILPIEFTLSRFWGELSSAYYFGRAGDQMVTGSVFIQPQEKPKLKLVGANLKKYRNYGYLGGAVFVSGISMTTYAWFSALGDDEKPRVLNAGLGAIVAGRLLRLIPLEYARSAGKKLESISLPTGRRNNLMLKAGKSMQAYANRTYWGYGLQALGITLALAAGNDCQMKAIGIGTAVLSGFIFDAIGASAANAAGKSLEELGNFLVQGEVRQNP